MRRFTLALAALAALAALCLATPVRAQSARATGSVKDTDGKALKGATVRAVNKEAYPPEITSSTDDRGRWAMIGLRTGMWTFFAEAPGFSTVQTQWQVRVAGTAPIGFVLGRDLGPIPGALTRNIQQQLASANALRDKGQYDQAIAAYELIRDQNPKLTSMNLVVGSAYRRKAAQDGDPATRRALFDRAIASYTALLASDAGNERLKAEIESTRTEALSR
jgi:tetratricopeptide (TPR) repeat protein